MTPQTITSGIPMARTLDIESLTLQRGNHDSPETGMCLMEAVAYVAGEDHTDSPSCASPILSTFLRNLNDTLDDQQRQELKPLIPLLVGTNTGPEDEQRRGLMAVDWLVREYVPSWLALAKIDDLATALRSSPEVRTWDDLVAITPTMVRAQERAAAAWGAARDVAWVAARDAAWDAAWDAARAAAGAAAWDAAGAAAWDAAWAAARAAAGAAAWAAAGDAAGDALRPTVMALQQSAIALAHRMTLRGQA